MDLSTKDSHDLALQSTGDAFYEMFPLASVSQISDWLGKYPEDINRHYAHRFHEVALRLSIVGLDPDKVELLLKSGADVNFLNRDGQTILVFAAAMNNGTQETQRVVELIQNSMKGSRI